MILDINILLYYNDLFFNDDEIYWLSSLLALIIAIYGTMQQIDAVKTGKPYSTAYQYH